MYDCDTTTRRLESTRKLERQGEHRRKASKTRETHGGRVLPPGWILRLHKRYMNLKGGRHFDSSSFFSIPIFVCAIKN